MNSEGTSHILCKRDKKYYVSVWDQIKLQKTGVTISFWLVQFSLFTLFSYREKICCFGLQYFVCRFIYLFNSYLFVFFLYFILIYYFLPLATSFYYVPAEIAEEKVTILIVDCGVQRFLLKTSSSFTLILLTILRYKNELDSASSSSYKTLK